MSTATFLIDLPDDRPKVSELIEFYELLIKGQLEKSHTDAFRKIRNAVNLAVNDHQGMSLLLKAVEEPTLLQELRIVTQNRSISNKGTSPDLPKVNSLQVKRSLIPENSPQSSQNQSPPPRPPVPNLSAKVRTSMPPPRPAAPEKQAPLMPPPRPAAPKKQAAPIPPPRPATSKKQASLMPPPRPATPKKQASLMPPPRPAAPKEQASPIPSPRPAPSKKQAPSRPPAPKLLKSLDTSPHVHKSISNAPGPPIRPPLPKLKPKSQTAPPPRPPPHTRPPPLSQLQQRKSLEVRGLSEYQDPLSPEYITLKEMLADLVDLLAGNAPVINQLNNHLFSLGLIPRTVHIDVQNTVLSPYDRSNKMISSVLAILESHPNPVSIYSSLINSVEKAGLLDMASKLTKKLEKNGGLSLKDELQFVPESDLQNLTVQQSFHPTVIQISSKEEVACSIEDLYDEFTGLVRNIRMYFETLQSSGKLEAADVALQAEEYMRVPIAGESVDEVFKAILPHYDFFNFGLLKNLVHHFIPKSDKIHTELTQYIDRVDKFSESSQLKHIRTTIDDKLSSLQASPTNNNQAKLVIIKLNYKWDEMTIKNLKRVLEYYFGSEESDLFSYISIKRSSVLVTLSVPSSLAQSFLEAVASRINSMNRLGVIEVTIDKKTVPIREEDDNNFDIPLHQSVKTGALFEVSMLLQLGADPNSKDMNGKSTLEIATEFGHTELIETLLIGGAVDITEIGEVKWTDDGVELTEPSGSQCEGVISKLQVKHQNVVVNDSSSYIVHLLVPSLLSVKTVKALWIKSSPSTSLFMYSLSFILSRNRSLKSLTLTHGTISDDGAIAIAKSLQNNTSLTDLDISFNYGITSLSAPSLVRLLHINCTLTRLSLSETNIDTDGVIMIVESLKRNNTLQTLGLDSLHKHACSSLPYYAIVHKRLIF